VQLGEFVARLRFEDLPPNVVDKGKALINHSVTVGLACSNAPRAPPPPRPGGGAPAPRLPRRRVSANGRSAAARARRCGSTAVA
jgi:hypothetical protein